MVDGLKAFVMLVPPLRERKSDIPRLANHFLEKCSRDHEKSVTRLSAAAADAVMRYGWPGNVGELEDALEQAVFACEGQVNHVRHLPLMLQPADSSHAYLSAAMDNYERELIEDALKTARGNRAKAARLLDTTERIINYRIKNLAIDYKRFRPAGTADMRPSGVHAPASESVRLRWRLLDRAALAHGHSVACFEVASRARDDLAVGGMIRRLDADDF